MSHETDALRTAWQETDELDLVAGLDARLAGAIHARTRRRRATFASTAVLVIAVALLAPGEDAPSGEAPSELTARVETPSGVAPSGGAPPTDDAGSRPDGPTAAREAADTVLALGPAQQDTTTTNGADTMLAAQAAMATVLTAQDAAQAPGTTRRTMRTLPRLPMAPTNRSALATRMAAQRAALSPASVGTLPRSPRRPVRKPPGDGTPLDARAPLDASTEGVHA